MLRINPTRLLFRDIKEGRVKIRDIIQKTTLASVHFPGLAFFAVEPINIPTLTWNFSDRVHAL